MAVSLERHLMLILPTSPIGQRKLQNLLDTRQLGTHIQASMPDLPKTPYLQNPDPGLSAVPKDADIPEMFKRLVVGHAI